MNEQLSPYERERQAMHLRAEIRRAMVNAEKRDKLGDTPGGDVFRKEAAGLERRLADLDSAP